MSVKSFEKEKNGGPPTNIQETKTASGAAGKFPDMPCVKKVYKDK